MNGSLKLFRLFGVNVFVHWSWLLIAVVRIYAPNVLGGVDHGSLGLNVALFLSLFLIVLTHEFGHALACKSVGGRADRIVLWPLGGVAFVQPPPRPGALLWSIAAGPLVNVVLLPITIIPAFILYFHSSLPLDSPVTVYFVYLALMNAVLLLFNMLPIYPLDGGQILQALLWFVLDRSTALIITAGIGIAGAAALMLFALYSGSFWLSILAFFAGFQAFNGVRIGLQIRRMEKMPRHPDPICPACGNHPIVGQFWRCNCGTTFDTFASGGRCPVCGNAFATTQCPECKQAAPFDRWYSSGGFPIQPPPLAPPPPAPVPPSIY